MFNYIYPYEYQGTRKNRKKLIVAKYKNIVCQYNLTGKNTNIVPVQKENDLSTSRNIFLNFKDV